MKFFKIPHFVSFGLLCSYETQKTNLGYCEKTAWLMPKIEYNTHPEVRSQMTEDGRQMAEKISTINYSRTTSHENRATSDEISPQHIVIPGLTRNPVLSFRAWPGIQEKIAMAKPFHIGSSMSNVEREFTLSLPKGRSPSLLIGSTPGNYFFYKTNPILTFTNEG